MLQNIPTHVIAGPLGAGKTSLIKHLLAQRPANERWAVLINEFGQIGLDAALLTLDDDGIALGEVAGGCLCCVNGAPFQVGLGRLLRKARPDRLFIEPSGLGHPAQLLKQLREAPWQNVLAVQPCVLVLDAQALAAGKALPPAQQEALSAAGLLVLNKDEALDEQQRQAIERQLPDCPLYWTHQAHLPLQRLPGLDAQAGAAVDNQLGASPLKALQPLRQAQGIELLTWVPAPANTPASLLGLAQADRLYGIAPDRRHLRQPFRHVEVIHSPARLGIQAWQLFEGHLRLARPVERAIG